MPIAGLDASSKRGGLGRRGPIFTGKPGCRSVRGLAEGTRGDRNGPPSPRQDALSSPAARLGRSQGLGPDSGTASRPDKVAVSEGAPALGRRGESGRTGRRRRSDGLTSGKLENSRSIGRLAERGPLASKESPLRMRGANGPQVPESVGCTGARRGRPTSSRSLGRLLPSKPAADSYTRGLRGPRPSSRSPESRPAYGGRARPPLRPAGQSRRDEPGSEKLGAAARAGRWGRSWPPKANRSISTRCSRAATIGSNPNLSDRIL